MTLLAQYKYFAVLLHVLSAVVWVGGMFFAYQCLRPVAATLLEPPQRLSLWVKTFEKFFPYVWFAVIALPLTGYWIMFTIWGTFRLTPLYIHWMQALGIVMILIYMHVYFAPFQRLKRAVNTQNWQEGGKQLGQIRRMIGINLALGLLVIVTASGGRFF